MGETSWVQKWQMLLLLQARKARAPFLVRNVLPRAPAARLQPNLPTSAEV